MVTEHSKANEPHNNGSETQVANLPKWQYLYGQPKVNADLRTYMADFKVIEQLPFSPCGEGEHLYIYLRKTGENTAFVARALAKYFQIKEHMVSYAGLKDRFAVTEQWFAAHLPGKKHYDLADFALDGVEILQVKRHNKKLRTGALSGNRFELILRNVSDIDELSRRWHAVTAHGVPNYFGEQRFGINGGNIAKAASLFNGSKVKDKKKRGLYLSAARSVVFNDMVSERIKQNIFDTALKGEVMMLSGSQSVFLHDNEADQASSTSDNCTADNKISQRLLSHDIDITAPMWGAGQLMTTAEAQAFEQAVAEQHSVFCQGLPRFGLKQERRRIRLLPTATKLSVLSESGLGEELELAQNSADENNQTTAVMLSFFLPAGCFATTVLRELVNYQDLTQRKAQRQGT